MHFLQRTGRRPEWVPADQKGEEKMMETQMTADKISLKEKARLFEETALPHLDSLYRTALRLTRKEKDAEDLVQETAMRAFKSFHLFQQGTNIKAWLFKIMTNIHINNYQKERRKPVEISYDGAEEFYLYDKLIDNPELMKKDNVEEEFLSRFLDWEVKEALETLPLDFMITVVLAEIEGFKYREIADILDCPVGTVRSRLSRGRQLLRKHLWEYAQKRNYVKEKQNGKFHV